METFFILSPSKLNRHPWRWFGGEKMMGEDRGLPSHCFSHLLFFFWILPIFIQRHAHPLSLEVNSYFTFSILHLWFWFWFWFSFIFSSIFIGFPSFQFLFTRSVGMLGAIDFVVVDNFVNYSYPNSDRSLAFEYASWSKCIASAPNFFLFLYSGIWCLYISVAMFVNIVRFWLFCDTG